MTKPCKQLKKLSNNVNYQHKSNVFPLRFIFIGPKINFSNKLFEKDMDEIFPIQLSEFTKLLYFECNLKKKMQ